VRSVIVFLLYSPGFLNGLVSHFFTLLLVILVFTVIVSIPVSVVSFPARRRLSLRAFVGVLYTLLHFIVS